ncbi:MAG: ABC transporter ATP-binding protein [Thermoleophilia bacterium]|nr:ABC transporter ATP-binding protein [Thermoleophilia bacterium]
MTPTEASARSGDAGLELRGVGKTYGSGAVAVQALKHVDLGIAPGQFVVILGPSGSGKTTLLNIVGGIEEPSEGSLSVAGQELASLSRAELTRYRREQVGFVFQFFNLVPTLTALENVELVAELAGQSERSAEALADVGLADRLERFPSELSGGEQQRVAIARALVKRPRLLLCDEPTGSLDLDTGRQVLALLHAASRGDGRTVVVVTHNSAIARAADRVIRMGSGEIVADEVQDSPIGPGEVVW